MESKSIKTIVLSELPKNEKVKYFQFLIDNDINFTKDEQGNYVALVKVLNPQFYGDVEVQQERMKEELRASQQAKSSSITKQANFSSQVKNQEVKSSSKVTTNQIQNEAKRIISGTQSQNQQNLNIKTSQVKKDWATNTGNDILKYLRSAYSAIMNQLQPLVGVRPKKLNYYQLKYFMEEIYSIKFMMDTATLRSKIDSNKEENQQSFASFLIEFKTEKYVKKPLIDKNVLDILVTADYYKDKYKEVDTFIKFLTEEYDADDLIFFLFVRTCIEKEMKMLFMEKAKEEIKLQFNEDKELIDTELYLNIKVCVRIAKTVFGENEDDLLKSFMDKVEQHLVSNKVGKNVISSTKIMEVMLEDYHASRRIHEQTTINQNSHHKLMVNNQELFNNTLNVKPTISKQGNEMSQGNSESYLSYLKNLIFEYLKEKELDDLLMQSYVFNDNDHPKVETILNSIKEKVGTKLSLLISLIFADQKAQYYECLRIKDETDDELSHYEHLKELKDELLKSKEGEVPEGVLNEFCVTLLSTVQLVNQINRLIFNNFGPHE